MIIGTEKEIMDATETLCDDLAALDASTHAFGCLVDLHSVLADYCKLRARAVNYRFEGSIGRAEQAERVADNVMVCLRHDDVASAVAYLRSEGLQTPLAP